MPIRMMCDASAPGAVRNDYWSKAATDDKPALDIFTRETHNGLVLETREHNMRDDSDFYALVWSYDKAAPEKITYASTRGWTYPNSASVDATDEVRALYAAYLQREREASQRRYQRSQDMTPTRGKRIRFERGTTVKASDSKRRDLGRIKITAGTEGEIIYYAEQREFGAMPRGGYKEHSRDLRRMVDSMLPPSDGHRRGYRVGVRLDNGNVVFTAATNVIVILPPGSEPEAEAAIERREDIDANEPGDLSPQDERLQQGLRA